MRNNNEWNIDHVKLGDRSIVTSRCPGHILSLGKRTPSEARMITKKRQLEGVVFDGFKECNPS